MWVGIARMWVGTALVAAAATEMRATAKYGTWGRRRNEKSVCMSSSWNEYAYMHMAVGLMIINTVLVSGFRALPQQKACAGGKMLGEGRGRCRELVAPGSADIARWH